MVEVMDRFTFGEAEAGQKAVTEFPLDLSSSSLLDLGGPR